MIDILLIDLYISNSEFVLVFIWIKMNRMGWFWYYDIYKNELDSLENICIYNIWFYFKIIIFCRKI